MERIGIIGGGIVGIAIARALSQRADTDVTVLEKERRVASHQTGHNSGVVHAGVYYAPGSLKAKLCAAGRELTREYCVARNLPFRAVGKLVVAVTNEEVPRLDDIEQRARANRVPELKRLDREELTLVEPHAAGVTALHSPRTAVTDYVAIAESMANEVRAAGGQVQLGQEVVRVSQQLGKVELGTDEGDYLFDRVIVCAGLQSDVVAKMVGASPAPKILPFRGEYWELAPDKQHLVNGLIYPVPDPRFPFLGVHFTRGVYDGVRVGPNAVPALAREGYSWGRVSVRDTWESLTWPGAFPLAKQHWRMGVREVSASLIKSMYFRAARKYVPELRIADLSAKAAAGVRAQAWGKDGSLLDDFVVDQVGPVTLLRNAPSPAATSAMAIADYVLENYMSVRHSD